MRSMEDLICSNRSTEGMVILFLSFLGHVAVVKCFQLFLTFKSLMSIENVLL